VHAQQRRLQQRRHGIGIVLLVVVIQGLFVFRWVTQQQRGRITLKQRVFIRGWEFQSERGVQRGHFRRGGGQHIIIIIIFFFFLFISFFIRGIIGIFRGQLIQRRSSIRIVIVVVIRRRMQGRVQRRGPKLLPGKRAYDGTVQRRMFHGGPQRAV